MNFAYLDTRSLLETVLNTPMAPPVQPTPYELDEEWKNFEKELGNFKSKFTKARADYTKTSAKLRAAQEEVNVVRMMIDNVSSQGLKQKLSDLVDNHESEEGVDALTQQCSVAAGKVEAMKKALMDTNAERYGKFTCFVCMERLVDLFIDPCGHVMCDACWIRTPNKDQCPACRVPPHAIRKIFTMN